MSVTRSACCLRKPPVSRTSVSIGSAGAVSGELCLVLFPGVFLWYDEFSFADSFLLFVSKGAAASVLHSKDEKWT